MSFISKSLAKIICPSLLYSRPALIPRRKWVISQQIRFSSAVSNGKTGGGVRKPRAKAPVKPPEVIMSETVEKELPRPKEIAYQQEVANWVNLIGFVDQPVQFEASAGKCWAGTVISQRTGSVSSFWVPIIFEGDLAKIAARHVKKDDQIHIFGKLFIDSPPPNMKYAQANVQVMVQNLNFVQPTTPATTKSLPEKEENDTEKRPVSATSLIDYPKSTVLARSKMATDETSDTWKHLLENPTDWWDYRDNKANGLVKPRHPDFKRKDGTLSLWLNNASTWVLPLLEDLKFDVPLSKPREARHRTSEESWKDLAENPDKWWDNRHDKRNIKAPDFKHKETGEALWLNESPAWILSKLPPSKKKQQEALGKTSAFSSQF